MDLVWEVLEGVFIDVIIFGGCRFKGVFLVYEVFNWCYGVFVGSVMCFEFIVVVEYKGKIIMYDLFVMWFFFGYNFGYYLEYWLSMEGCKGV